LGSPNQNSETTLNSIHRFYTIKSSLFFTDLFGKSGFNIFFGRASVLLLETAIQMAGIFESPFVSDGFDGFGFVCLKDIFEGPIEPVLQGKMRKTGFHDFLEVL
jgi:hypothetical protein